MQVLLLLLIVVCLLFSPANCLQLPAVASITAHQLIDGLKVECTPSADAMMAGRAKVALLTVDTGLQLQEVITQAGMQRDRALELIELGAVFRYGNCSYLFCT
jgi:hypothetical protein